MTDSVGTSLPGAALRIAAERLLAKLKVLGGGFNGMLGPELRDLGAALEAGPSPREPVEARKAVHNTIDANLDEIVWRARERLERSDKIATYRAAIHDAVRVYRDALLGVRGESLPEKGE